MKIDSAPIRSRFDDTRSSSSSPYLHIGRTSSEGHLQRLKGSSGEQTDQPITLPFLNSRHRAFARLLKENIFPSNPPSSHLPNIFSFFIPFYYSEYFPLYLT